MTARTSKFAIGLFALMAVVAGSAQAHGRVYFGVSIGAPWPYYYSPYPPVYYPPVVVATPAPQVTYVEQAAPVAAAPAPAPAPANIWYYCAGSQTYYPYVRDCPGGWQAVPATPPAAPR